MLNWSDFISLLGVLEGSYDFEEFMRKIDERPTVDEGPLGDRKYFSFYRRGIFFLIEAGCVCQVSLYFFPHEGFSIYEGDVIFGLTAFSTEEKIVGLLGKPESEGGGKEDVLLGYLNKWIKYEIDDYFLHVEFSVNRRIFKLSLMQNKKYG